MHGYNEKLKEKKSEKLVFYPPRGSHWEYKPLLTVSRPMPSSKWPTQNKLNSVFGSSWSHNVVLGHLLKLHKFFENLLWLQLCVISEFLCFCIYKGFFFFCVFVLSSSDLSGFTLSYFILFFLRCLFVSKEKEKRCGSG